MANVYIALGSNIGDRVGFLTEAIRKIKKIGEVRSVSSLYESEPMGFEAETKFLNAVLELETTMDPLELLKKLKNIEEESGRKEKSSNQNYTSRELDLDIILYDRQIILSKDLVIPHPEYTRRRFVLEPFVEIARDCIDPISQLKMKTILEQCEDKSELICLKM
jgi:2-amino-4-hydroxy-6-hydroxymethyldihydropteridine diphosphokinase